jgi:hypothetical protein
LACAVYRDGRGRGSRARERARATGTGTGGRRVRAARSRARARETGGNGGHAGNHNKERERARRATRPSPSPGPVNEPAPEPEPALYKSEALTASHRERSVPPSGRRYADYAAVRRPYGNSGTGRTLPPHMNAATFGRRGGSNPPRITIPRTSRRSVADRSTFFRSILPPGPTPRSFRWRFPAQDRRVMLSPGAFRKWRHLARPRVLQARDVPHPMGVWMSFEANGLGGSADLAGGPRCPLQESTGRVR